VQERSLLSREAPLFQREYGTPILCRSAEGGCPFFPPMEQAVAPPPLNALKGLQERRDFPLLFLFNEWKTASPRLQGSDAFSSPPDPRTHPRNQRIARGDISLSWRRRRAFPSPPFPPPFCDIGESRILSSLSRNSGWLSRPFALIGEVSSSFRRRSLMRLNFHPSSDL